jgi:hypothetical protein
MEQLGWLLRNQPEGPQVTFLTFDDIDLLDKALNQVLVMSEGWTDGSVAAVLRGGSNATAALNLLAQSGITNLTIFHIEEKVPEMEEIFLSTVVSVASNLFDNVNVRWRRENSIQELIAEIGREFDMLVFGAPLIKSEVLTFYNKIKKVYQGKITIVRAPIADMEFADGDEIFRWVRGRNYDAGDFAVPAALSAYKRKLQKKIAVCLPALNEEKTVGKVIETALDVKNAGLIDEVIVIDSASADATREIAASYGVPVFVHAEIRPDLGAFRGKGEAMYKSTFVTDADIIAWVDTDIENIAPRFFYGLLGPMLTYPEIKFSKGYFARPVRVDAAGIELGGGRVTEILARPYINLYLPQLSGYIQPLAGTVAIYRQLLSTMRIPTNYGIEIAMLAQAVANAGLWATCQVNLGEVIHKSKDVIGLSEMALQILQVADELRFSSEKSPATTSAILRRVFSAGGNFEICHKRFKTQWRQFSDG